MFNKSEAILKKMLVWNCHLGGMGPRRKGGKFFFFLKVEIEEYDMLKKSAESFFFQISFPLILKCTFLKTHQTVSRFKR